MNVIGMITCCLYGVIARILNCVVPVKNNYWVFGSDYGNTYREGTKYLYEYMLKNHPEFKVLFVTQSKDVYASLMNKNKPCVLNVSLKGILAVIRAECIFTSQDATDILYAFKKRNRRFYYIVHGQPLKIAQLALSKKILVRSKIKTLIRAIISFIKSSFVCDHGNECSEFVSSTSDFLKIWMEKDFDNQVPVKVLGMPRNDVLFQSFQMESEKCIDGIQGKFVISYMPTHRLYGRGKISPTPFEHFPEAQRWMVDNNAVLLVKNHPNMLKQFTSGGYHPYESESVKDITALRIDPMAIVQKSDILITDYSSVWMDYLLLRRPLVFYIYDNFAQDDVGIYYDPIKESSGHVCYTENELFRLIKQIKEHYDDMRPSECVVHKFHKYVDGNSCKRYFDEIVKSCECSSV